KTIGRFSRNSPLEIDRRQFVHTPLLTLARTAGQYARAEVQTQMRTAKQLARYIADCALNTRLDRTATGFAQGTLYAALRAYENAAPSARPLRRNETRTSHG
ncbi:hypothetical protein, partial [Trinickia diaoshuihuensis]|uniref:hypothetical protein n=1 Tax=Trinickia diaoshuihuensis TaxID=2292265 RepID=UPI0019685812